MSGVVVAGAREVTDAEVCRRVLADAYAQKLRHDLMRDGGRAEDIHSIPLPRLAQVKMWDWFVQTDPSTAKSLSKDLGMGYDEIITAAREARGCREGKSEMQLEDTERALLLREVEAARELVESIGLQARSRLDRATFDRCFWQYVCRWDWSPPPGRIRSSVRDDIDAVIEQLPQNITIKKLFVNYAERRYFLTQ